MELTFKPRDRVVGSHQTPRKFLDFQVDGLSLLDILGEANGDWISGFTADWPAGLSGRAGELLVGPTEDVPGRVAIYVCPECGDMGCGAISARVHVGDHEVVWDTFAYENLADTFEPIEGAFQFERSQYENSINEAVLRLVPIDGRPH